MFKRTRIALLFVLLFQTLRVKGDVHVGLKTCNNQFDHSWVMTLAPEMALVWKWFSLGLDGTVATYTPSNAPENYQLQMRVSFYPLLRIPLRRFFLETGYGISKTFVRDEIWTNNSGYRFTADETFHGEFRTDAGCVIPMSDDYRLILKGGYAHQKKTDRFFFVSMGVGFGAHKRAAAIAQESAPPQVADIRPPVESLASSVLKNVSLIGGTDIISGELNAAIEAALVQSGIQVTSWEKIRTSVEEQFQKQAKAANPKSSFTSLFTDSLNNMEIALYGSKLLPLDAIIETSIRYAYKTYGEDIIVQSAFMKMIDPPSGNIIWAAEYGSPDPSFIRCKQKLITDLLNAIKQQVKVLKNR
jgi:hypothetical protein